MKQSHFSFDYLEKISYTSVLFSIEGVARIKLIESIAKSPTLDYSKQEKMCDDLQKIYIWTCALFEEKELLQRHNMNLERLNLELKEKLTENEKRLTVLEQIDKFK